MKIVLTGDSSVEKTTIAHIMECQFSHELALVANTAEIIKSALPLERISAGSQKCYQRAIYYMQVELENIVTFENPNKLILCDNGTLDCLNKWPESAVSFFKDVKSSLNTELKRYDLVIQINNIDTAPETDFKKNHTLDTHSFWSHHPNIVSISSNNSFRDCYSEVARILKLIINDTSNSELKHKLQNKQIY